MTSVPDVSGLADRGGLTDAGGDGAGVEVGVGIGEQALRTAAMAMSRVTPDFTWVRRFARTRRCDEV